MSGTKGLAAFMIASGVMDCIEAVYRQAPLKQTKCLLKGCDNLTSHNTGFCCAEHCRVHRKRKETDHAEN